jgi:hypothetical protein
MSTGDRRRTVLGVATIDRAVTARPGLGDWVPGRAGPAGSRAGWWRDWFCPARRLLPQPVDVLVALAIAFVQVAGTMVYSQDEPSRLVDRQRHRVGDAHEGDHDRRDQLGVLRAVGQSRGQTRAMVRGEALIVALFGTVAGVGLGLFLSWALASALAGGDELSFTSFAVPTGSLGVVLALGALIGVVAAVRPAHRAARMDVLSAVATRRDPSGSAGTRTATWRPRSATRTCRSSSP